MSAKLSTKLQSIAQGEFFYGEALYQAYFLESVVTSNDKQMLHRYMHGGETVQDRFRLQDFVIRLNEAGF